MDTLAQAPPEGGRGENEAGGFDSITSRAVETADTRREHHQTTPPQRNYIRTTIESR